MALPFTSITTTAVGTALGSSSHNLRVLCTDSNINPWARYRPGYLESDGTSDKFLVYQPPQGGAYTDPRGYNSDSGSSLEGYRLGDFRGYNHSAIDPYVNFPTGTIDYGSSATSATGLSLTFYAGEVDWENDGVYRSVNNFPECTNVHLLNASDDSIAGTALIPAIGGNVSIPIDPFPISAGNTYNKTYHVAFGVDATHWSVKLGTNYGAGGIGTITVRCLAAPTVLAAIFIDTSFGGGANDPYTSCDIVGVENYAITGTDTATFRFTTLSAFECFYSGGSDFYRNIAATWWVKGFNENPATEYEYKNANIASNNAANTVDLGATWVDTPPHLTWEDGDEIILVLRDLTINF